MTTIEKRALAVAEVTKWRELLDTLANIGAVTRDDLHRVQGDVSTPGCRLINLIREWGELRGELEAAPRESNEPKVTTLAELSFREAEKEIAAKIAPKNCGYKGGKKQTDLCELCGKARIWHDTLLGAKGKP